MGIYAHNFYGYAIDVKKEYDEINEDYYHIFDYEEENKEIIDKFRFSEVKLYWLDRDEFKKGDVVFLYNGMSGSYAKLFYILEEEDFAEDEYEELVLKDKIQDNEAKIKLKESYEKLFSKDSTNIEIELIKFSHLH